jgi:uncharacterized membrane protein HdeD (DUF308 family)
MKMVGIAQAIDGKSVNLSNEYQNIMVTYLQIATLVCGIFLLLLAVVFQVAVHVSIYTTAAALIVGVFLLVLGIYSIAKYH